MYWRGWKRCWEGVEEVLGGGGKGAGRGWRGNDRCWEGVEGE